MNYVPNKPDEKINASRELINEYKVFNDNYNELLEKQYPSFVDEIKRELWLTNKIKIHKDYETVCKGIFALIVANFKHSNLINLDYAEHIKYLTEKGTDKIYRVNIFKKDIFYYSTISENAILGVKFEIKKGYFFKKNVFIKYAHRYFAKSSFSYATMSEIKQRLDAKAMFKKQFQLVKNKIEKYFMVGE